MLMPPWAVLFEVVSRVKPALVRSATIAGPAVADRCSTATKPPEYSVSNSSSRRGSSGPRDGETGRCASPSPPGRPSCCRGSSRPWSRSGGAPARRRPCGGRAVGREDSRRVLLDPALAVRAPLRAAVLPLLFGNIPAGNLARGVATVCVGIPLRRATVCVRIPSAARRLCRNRPPPRDGLPSESTSGPASPSDSDRKSYHSRGGSEGMSISMSLFVFITVELSRVRFLDRSLQSRVPKAKFVCYKTCACGVFSVSCGLCRCLCPGATCLRENPWSPHAYIPLRFAQSYRIWAQNHTWAPWWAIHNLFRWSEPNFRWSDDRERPITSFGGQTTGERSITSFGGQTT